MDLGRWFPWGAIAAASVLLAPAMLHAQDLEGLLDRLREQVQRSELGEYLPAVDATADPNLMAGEAGDHARQLLRELDRLLDQQPGTDTSSEAGSSAATAGATRVIYVDDKGARREVDSIEEVPEPLREHAVEVEQEASEESPEPPAYESKAPQKIYRLRGENGRTLYTNVEAQIPVEERVSAEVSLSHVPLNSALGTEINKRLEKAHEKLVTSRICQDVREDGSAAALVSAGAIEPGPLGWIQTHVPIVVCSGLLLLLFLISPAMLRKVDGQAWRRVLMFAIPTLTIFGLVGQGLSGGGQRGMMLQTLDAGCDPGAFSSLESSASPLRDRFILVRSLQRQMAEVDAMYEDGNRPGQ